MFACYNSGMLWSYIITNLPYAKCFQILINTQIVGNYHYCLFFACQMSSDIHDKISMSNSMKPWMGILCYVALQTWNICILMHFKFIFISFTSMIVVRQMKHIYIAADTYNYAFSILMSSTKNFNRKSVAIIND